MFLSLLLLLLFTVGSFRTDLTCLAHFPFLFLSVFTFQPAQEHIPQSNVLLVADLLEFKM